VGDGLARLRHRLLGPSAIASWGRLLGPRVLPWGRNAAGIARVRDTYAARCAAPATPATAPAAASTAWLAALGLIGRQLGTWRCGGGRECTRRRLLAPRGGY